MCASGNVAKTVGHALSICHLKATLPLLEFPALLRSSRVPCSFFVIKGKVQI
jgi:hypothetical protein